MQKAAPEKQKNDASHKIAATGLIQDASPVRRGPIRSLVLGGTILILAIALGTAIMVNNFRERALNSSKRELENTVLLLARHFDQQLQDWQIIQKDFINYIQTLDISSADEFKRAMSSESVHLSLKAKIGVMPYVGAVTVFDANGQLINSSGSWPLPNVNVADRAYYKTFASGPSSPDVIVQQVTSRVTGMWTTNILRKIVGPHGEFFGLVSRGIEPAHFETFFASLQLGNNSAVSIFHADGTLLARYPHVDAMIGKNFGHGPLFASLGPFKDHESGRVVSPVDGEDRMGAVRKLQNFPLVIIATTTVSSTLSDWLAHTKLLIVVACLASAVIAALLFLIVKRLSHQHRLQQERLTLEKQRLDTAINNMRPGLLLFDSSQHLVIYNRRYPEMFNLAPDELQTGWSFREVIEYRKKVGSFKANPEEYCARVLNGVEKGTSFVTEGPDNRVIQVTVQPVGDGGWVSTHEDITERRRSEERIAYLAQFDALTDLPNRTSFRERLEQMLSDLESGDRLAVLYIDIDQFKTVNDTLGHHVGDELLKTVANRLSGCVRDTDLVARLGGDEFAVVRTSIQDVNDVEDLIARIYEALRAPCDCMGHQLTSDASIGIAFAPDNGDDMEKLLKNADLAMYSAKSEGRRTHRFFVPDMEIRAQRRRELEAEMRQAITDNGFDIHYQPLLDIQSDRVVGCEALLRWPHPERGMISPAEFIPIAEEAGLIDQLGLWVLTTACAEAVKWPDHVKLAVNVSPLQFKQPTFALKVASALATSGLAPRRLELEITEAVLIRDDDEALAILHHLRALGVRIALDDFGTGYSSLSYLQRFPFDKIKIDRSFVDGIEDKDFSSSIVQAIVHIAAARNMTTTAEGVETQEQLEQLRALGCDQIQGYLFSRPRPAAELAARFFQGTSEVTAEG